MRNFSIMVILVLGDLGVLLPVELFLLADLDTETHLRHMRRGQLRLALALPLLIHILQAIVRAVAVV